MRRLLKYLIDGGVHGLFVVGTTGEFYGLKPEEKRDIFKITMDETNGKIPVYAGTNGITTRETVIFDPISRRVQSGCSVRFNPNVYFSFSGPID